MSGTLAEQPASKHQKGSLDARGRDYDRLLSQNFRAQVSNLTELLLLFVLCCFIWINHLRKTDNIRWSYRWSTMAKLMKNRTDNDIKNKWNSMKRMEKAGRKRKMPQTYDAISDTNVVEKQAKKQFHADKWIETGGCDTHSSNHKIQVRTSEEIPCLKFSPTPAIIPTVTDGISKESSPIVKKIRWKYEV